MSIFKMRLLLISHYFTGGLKNSALINNIELSNYIPFLPLERDHIIMCLEKEVKNLGQIMSDELKE